jgi:hypothetical protein
MGSHGLVAVFIYKCFMPAAVEGLEGIRVRSLKFPRDGNVAVPFHFALTLK